MGLLAYLLEAEEGVSLLRPEGGLVWGEGEDASEDPEGGLEDWGLEEEEEEEEEEAAEEVADPAEEDGAEEDGAEREDARSVESFPLRSWEGVVYLGDREDSSSMMLGIRSYFIQNVLNKKTLASFLVPRPSPSPVFDHF